MGIRRRTPAEDIVEICDRIRAGEAKKVVAIDFGQSLVAKYATHLAESLSTPSDKQRAELVRQLANGSGPSDVAASVGAPLPRVFRIYRAMCWEEDARRELAREKEATNS